MKATLNFLPLLLLLASTFTGWSELKPIDQAKWLADRTADLDAVEKLKPEDQIEPLGKIVGGLESWNPIRANPPKKMPDDVELIFKRAQTSLLAIPGHAEYFQKKLNDLVEKFLEADAMFKKTGDDIPRTAAIQNLDAAQGKIFETLRGLPSHETARVLIDMLSDERTKSQRREDDKYGGRVNVNLHPNCDHAAMLLPLIVANCPFPSDRDYFPHSDLKVWQQWADQIKAGRRTFRLIGDPQEYSLEGPVREARNPDIARVAKRPGVLESAEARRLIPSTHSPTPWIVGMLVAVAGICGYVCLRKKR